MRKQLCEALINKASNTKTIFLTADLGFMALELLRNVMKERFINVGISEQNMISLSAGLSKENLNVWVYSIAPFIYARPFEQIRNDICFHNLPVKMIGNGGGYAYGVMGPTHHAIEDYGVLLTLPHMKVFVPAFNDDIHYVISIMNKIKQPSYLRMGYGEEPPGYKIPKYSQWRELIKGRKTVIIAIGPIAGSYIESILKINIQQRPSLWLVSELPIIFSKIPKKLISLLKKSAHLIVTEEHVDQGGLGMQILNCLTKNNISINKYTHLYAKAHHYKKYGSQKYLRKMSDLNPETLMSKI